MNLLTEKIEQWAMARDLHSANPDKQMLKIMEEVGELAKALAKDNHIKKIDAIGDIHIALNTLAMQLGTSMYDCVNHAYTQVKFRKGEFVNGFYVKQEDLSRGDEK